MICSRRKSSTATGLNWARVVLGPERDDAADPGSSTWRKIPSDTERACRLGARPWGRGASCPSRTPSPRTSRSFCAEQLRPDASRPAATRAPPAAAQRDAARDPGLGVGSPDAYGWWAIRRAASGGASRGRCPHRDAEQLAHGRPIGGSRGCPPSRCRTARGPADDVVARSDGDALCRRTRRPSPDTAPASAARRDPLGEEDAARVRLVRRLRVPFRACELVGVRRRECRTCRERCAAALAEPPVSSPARAMSGAAEIAYLSGRPPRAADADDRLEPYRGRASMTCFPDRIRRQSKSSTVDLLAGWRSPLANAWRRPGCVSWSCWPLWVLYDGRAAFAPLCTSELRGAGGRMLPPGAAFVKNDRKGESGNKGLFVSPTEQPVYGSAAVSTALCKRF